VWVEDDGLHWESPAGACASIAVSGIGASACIGRGCSGSNSRAPGIVNTSIMEVSSDLPQVGGDLLEARTVCHVGGYGGSSQAGASDSSGAVVRVTAGLVALNQTTENGSDGKKEEEVELHDVQISSVAFEFGSVFFEIG